MSTYEVPTAGSLTLDEQYIYGSSRLGVLRNEVRSYELTDHLGNVRSVIGELKDANNQVEVISATDYYPFGMIAKAYNSNNYRYGFNGKERDSEGTGGGGSTYDYGFRIYNAQIARFLSIGPVTVSGDKDKDNLKHTKLLVKLKINLELYMGKVFSINNIRIFIVGILFILILILGYKYLYVPNKYKQYLNSDVAFSRIDKEDIYETLLYLDKNFDSAVFDNFLERQLKRDSSLHGKTAYVVSYLVLSDRRYFLPILYAKRNQFKILQDSLILKYEKGEIDNYVERPLSLLNLNYAIDLWTGAKVQTPTAPDL